ncbi:hypothetical protein [Pseudomonas sp. GD04019]|uniref:hypothetical protein n=1 Tax=Pseudomonas sp. GD04019 TaxID=2975420 RepID=UPI00244C5953|nr:hypothetical protein [Pseudomonas sp. GD04019]MDH0036839.1 hypothetical protein [Pseudomonas sp. GD04019]
MPNKFIFWPSLIISLGITLFLITFVAKGLKNKTWIPAKGFSTYGPIKKATAFLALPLSLFFSAWLNLYYLAPRVITSFAGEESFKLDTASAQKIHGRRKVCDFSIKLRATESFLFKICTNSVFYAHSPKENFQVKMHTKESFLGLIVTGVDRAQ